MVYKVKGKRQNFPQNDIQINCKKISMYELQLDEGN